MIASLHRGMICVVLVVGSTSWCCVVHQLPRNEEKFHRASSKSRSTIIAQISEISIEFLIQNVRVAFLTVVIVRLFRRLEGYPFVYCLDVLLIAIYCFNVFIIACVDHKILSSSPSEC